MSSVSKHLATVAITCAGFLYSSQLLAECSTIKLVQTPEQMQSFGLLTMSGLDFDQIKFSLENENLNKLRERHFTLEPGLHSLSFVSYPYEQTRALTKNKQRRLQRVSSVNHRNSDKEQLVREMLEYSQSTLLAAQLKANVEYHISRDKNGNIALVDSKPIQCELADHDMSGQPWSAKTTTVLPSELQHQLDELVSQLQVADSNSFYVPVFVNDSFGVILDDEFKHSSVKVLSVTPLSVAQRIGLLSGDEIVSFNDHSVYDTNKLPKDVLSDLMAQATIFDEFKFVVKRQGQLLTLQANSKPNIVPKALFSLTETDDHLTLIKARELGSLNNLYSMVMSNLQSHIANRYPSHESVLIQGVVKHIPTLGIQGEINAEGNLVVNRVNNGLLATSGIKRGDVIFAVDIDKIEVNSARILIDYINRLKSGDSYNIWVKRNNNVELLQSKLAEFEEIPYSLVVDMASIEQAWANVNEQRARPRYRPFYIDQPRLGDGMHMTAHTVSGLEPTRK